jgi:hypothetical protein
MTIERRQSDELCDLIDLLFDERLDAAGVERLGRMLAGNEEAKRLYVAELNLRANLAWDLGMHGATAESGQSELDDLPRADGGQEQEKVELGSANDRFPAITTHPAGAPPIQQHSPLTFYHSSLSLSLIGSTLFSYAMAALILGAGILAVQAWETGRENASRESVALSAAGQSKSATKPLADVVGKITLARDCQWLDQTTAATGDAVRLGQAYPLASGVLEITYFTGARIILNGLAVYEVDSRNGGFLYIGAMTYFDRRSKAGSVARKTADQPMFCLHTPHETPQGMSAHSVFCKDVDFTVLVDKSGNAWAPLASPAKVGMGRWKKLPLPDTPVVVGVDAKGVIVAGFGRVDAPAKSVAGRMPKGAQAYSQERKRANKRQGERQERDTLPDS